MSQKILSDFDLGNASRILNAPSPTSAGELANRDYVDKAVEGLKSKDPCVVASQGNINLGSAPASIDGVTLASLDRVLIRAQTLPEENGIYIFNGAASPMTRSLDFNATNEVTNAIVPVDAGTSTGVTYRQTTVNPTIGTTAITFIVFGSATPVASETVSGTIEIATQAETDAGTDDLRAITPLKLTNFSGRAKRAAGTIGDGTNTQYDVSHNLATRDCSIVVYRNSSPWDTVYCDIERFDTNTARLRFAVAPATNAYRVVVTA